MFNDFDQSRVYEKLWRPYPVLEPGIALPDIEITPGLYYSSAFESGSKLTMRSIDLFFPHSLVGSSIEVSILSARNAARLLLQHFKGNMGPESKEIQEKRKSEL